MWDYFFNGKKKLSFGKFERIFTSAVLSKKLVKMNSITKFKQLLIGRQEAKGLEKDIIPSFIRSMRICLDTDPEMNHFKANRQLHFLGWNDIEVDYHTLQLAIACFEQEGVIASLLA